MKYINLFDTQAAYDAAEKYYPNVSYIEATDEVVYQENDPYFDIIVAKFTTTSANQNVKITNKQQYFSSIAVDGEPLTIGTGALNHTFASAGKHIVEYKALDTTLIPNSAFHSCSGLTSVTIPDSVTSIGNSAFFGCNRLTSVTIPDSVTSIGNNAFYGCNGLTSIVVENGNTKYDSRDNCNAIIETATNTLINGCKNTIIPNSVTSIGNNAFQSCIGLTSITIPNSVTSIGESAFYGCTGLTNITIPDSVTSIGDNAFAYCTGLTSVTIPNSVTEIGVTAFHSCSGLTSVTIGNSVTTIGNNAFQNCNGLTSIVVENGNTKYDSRDNCNAIIETATNTLIAGCKNTIIPNSVTSIGESAFYECTGLTSVTIPNSVTEVGEFAFYNCSGLTSITCLATRPPSIFPDTFQNVPATCPIYVPAESVFEYQNASGWGDREDYIQPIQ